MLTTITTHKVFPGVTTATLFDLYTNADLHTQVTGAPATINGEEGASFSAVDGFCSGHNIKIVKDQLIIQSWRSVMWPPEALDSILVLRYVQVGEDAHLFMTHADIPEVGSQELLAGWDTWYWDKYAAHLNVVEA